MPVNSMNFTFAFIIPLIFALLVIIFQGFGVYTISKRRNIGTPWLAFVPIASFWLIGLLADDFRQKTEGVSKNYARTILLLFGSAIAISLIAVILIMLGVFVGVAIMSLVSIVSIIGMVYYFIALYYLYNSCIGESSGLYIILSIFIPIVPPIALFVFRDRDDGITNHGFGKPLYR